MKENIQFKTQYSVEREFVEWLIEDHLIVRTDNNKWEVFKNESDYEWGDPYEEMDFDQIYNYWQMNFKK